jgi:hypothetical protein
MFLQNLGRFQLHGITLYKTVSCKNKGYEYSILPPALAYIRR